MIAATRFTRRGVFLIEDDGPERFVHTDELLVAQRWIFNDANSAGSASLYGMTVYEDQVTDWLHRIACEVRAATKQGRAS